MDFDLNDEQQHLRDSLQRFFAQESPVKAARRLMPTEKGYDPALWQRMADELGLPALAVPDNYGGLGASLVELAIVLEEMGGHLVASPFFSSAVLATRVLLHSGDVEAMGRYLPDIAAGNTIATVAIVEDLGSWDLDTISLAAERTADGYRLSGQKAFVTDGDLADLVLVVARSKLGLCLLAVDRHAPGLTRRACAAIDPTRRLARLQLEGTPAELIGADGAAGHGLRRALDEASVALGAEQVGGAQRCLDMAVAYSLARTAFGRPIGSFQAIKHKCADMFLGVESARSGAYHAAWSMSAEADDLPLAAAVTKAHCSEVYVRVAQQNIQIHGGIGFTWEHDAQLYLKRARFNREFLGSPDHHLQRIADQVGL